MRNEPNILIEQYRVNGKGFPESPSGATYGIFQIGPLRIISSGTIDPEERWEHVSISCENRTPTWEEMEEVKRLFWGDHETVIQFHPKASEYVNIHKYCLHLWRQFGIDHDLPPQEYV